MNYTIEAYDRTGQVFLHLDKVSIGSVVSLVRGTLQDPKTGGVVIYRPVTRDQEGGGRDEGEEGVGVVTSTPVAGGNGRLSYCRYCNLTGGHTADCPVIS